MLRALIEAGETAAVAELLAGSPELARQALDDDADGLPPLHLAAERDRVAIVELLVGAGADPHATYAASSHTALSWAVTCWSFRAAHKLVDLGVQPDLFCAAGLGLLPAVRRFWNGDGQLITTPALPSRTGSTRYAPGSGQRLPSPPPNPRDQVSDALYIACRCGQSEVARWLLDHGADPNWRGYYGATCLAWAEVSGDVNLCAFVREHGGSDDMLDHVYLAPPRLFPLFILAGWGFDADSLAARLDRDPSLANARTAWGTLLQAAERGANNPAIVRLLRERGAA